MAGSAKLTAVDAAAVAAQLGIDFRNEAFSLDKLRIGIGAELGSAAEGVTDEQITAAAQTAVARLREAPDHYTPVAKKVEKSAAAPPAAPEAAPVPAAAAPPAAPAAAPSLWERIKSWFGGS
jgi:hypothetical protein